MSVYFSHYTDGGWRPWPPGEVDEIMALTSWDPTVSRLAGLGWLARGRARACFPAGRAGLAGPAGLIKVAKKDWRTITTEYLKNLYESMPRRMAAVIAAGGRHTKY